MTVADGFYGGLTVQEMAQSLERLSVDLEWLGNYWQEHARATPNVEGTLTITSSVTITRHVVERMRAAIQELELM